jgi:hypothetical protein
VCQESRQDVNSELIIVKALINAGADLSLRFDDGKTALKYGMP